MRRIIGTFGALAVVAVLGVSNWIPLRDPAGGPSFFPLDEDARYSLGIDNTGDGVEDVSYRWEFRSKFRSP